MLASSTMAARRAGRYLLFDAIASGGMASVHLGRAIGTGGFARLVAVKRLHAHLANDPEFVEMFLDEARLASRIHHPNVVATLDVVNHEGELLLVMEHVLGESWWHLLRAARDRKTPVPVDIVSAVISGLLHGLHAAHEARSETGEPLELVHRDVSPHNLLVGADGVPRVVDFGIAKAVSRMNSTRDGELKGKLAYMAPEQVKRAPVDRRADVRAAGVILWESLTGERLCFADDAPSIIAAVLEGNHEPPSRRRPELSLELDLVVMKALASDPAARYSTALDFATALERVAAPASPRAVADFVADMAAKKLEERRQVVAQAEQTPSTRAPEMSAASSDVLPMGAQTAEERRALAAAETQVTGLDVGLAASEEATEPDHQPGLFEMRTRRSIAAVALFLTAVAAAATAFALTRRDPVSAEASPVAVESSEIGRAHV